MLRTESGAEPPQDARASWIGRAGLVFFAFAVYAPILHADPGRVVADTKSYLYLDPARFLARVSSLWDPQFALGTLSHQTIGYLFPMGPYYWFLENVLGVPAWVAQRLWLASIIFVAGLGIRYLMRTLGVRGAGVGVAVAVYAFSPYVLGYSSIYSVLLLPWAALPWWVGFADRGLRRGGWKYPALFALTVQIAGSVNGSALLFAALAPMLWIPYAVGILHRASWRRAWGLLWRTGLLTVLTSLWWLVALVVEGQTGVNILRFTESIEVVSATSVPFEILRGLGNWFFYGGDSGGYWVAARPYFTQRGAVVLVSLLIPALALLAAGTVRWRSRMYFALIVLLGVVISVGAAPYAAPSFLGGIYKSFALNSTAGFALRNTGRAVPLVVFGLAVLLGVGVRALMAWLRGHGRPKLAIAAVAVVFVMCAITALPQSLGGYFSRTLERGEIPGYWKRAIAALDAEPHDTRVLALPGSDFATYRWGDTREPIEPGLMSRPYVARELVPWGTPESLNLLSALDRRVQQQSLDPNALAPIVRLMGVGDVLLRSDLQTDRYSLVPATTLWQTFTDPEPAGLGAVQRFGTKIPGKLRGRELGDFTKPAGSTPQPPPVAVFPVKDPIPIVRAKSAADPVVVAGDADGLIDLATAGLLDAERTVLYSAPYEHHPTTLRNLPPDATLVVTDSNRRRGTRWSGLHDNTGYTEQAGEQPLRTDPSDQRLDPFPGSDDATRTVTVLHGGVASVRATRYGEPSFGFSPSQRPALALDGDVKTAWTVGARSPVHDERLEIALEHPITTDHVNLVQFSGRLEGVSVPPHRAISDVTLIFGDGSEVHRKIVRSSRRDEGQTLHFPRRTFRKLTIRIDGVRGHTTLIPATKNPVGWSEVRLQDDAPGSTPVRADEVIRMPTDLLRAAGASSAGHQLAIVMTRDDLLFVRQFTLPTARSFELTGTATLGALATDPALDRAVGLPDASQGGLTASSSARLGPPLTRASSAFDGDVQTAWQTPIGLPRKTIRFRVPAPISVDHLDLVLQADGRHSLPTQLSIRAGDGPKETVAVPSQPTDAPNGVVSVPVRFPALTGTAFSVKVEAVRSVKRSTLVMPVGIAELGVAGVRRGAVPAQMPTDCLRDLVAIDGHRVGVHVDGSTDDALHGRALTVRPCDPAPIDLGRGTHVVRAHQSAHNPTGIDVARLALTSGAGGAAVRPAAIAAPPVGASGPTVRAVHMGRTSVDLQVTGTTKPFWLVLGESKNGGWVATAGGKSLGASKLVDGYANGWRITPHGARTVSVHLDWTPQRSVRVALVVSLLSGLVVLGILVTAFARRRRVLADVDDVPTLGMDTPSSGPSTGVMVACVGVTAVVAAATVRPWVGVLVGVLVYLAVRRPRWRIVLRLAPAAIMVGVAFYIALAQFFERYPPRFDWVSFYDKARLPTWTAVLLIAADATISMLWRDDATPSGSTAPPPD